MPTAKKLKILFVTSEVMPFCKSGGVADVSSALPQKLIEQGHEVRLVVPKYGAIDERKFKIHEVVRLKDLKTKIGEKEITYSLRSSFLVGSKARVQLYLLDQPEYFGSRHSLYHDTSSGKEFEDNIERFSLLSHSVFDLIRLLGWIPDVIHCNDWQCGLVPAHLKTTYKDEEIFSDIRTLFTIHNLSSQGEFNKKHFNLLGLPEELNSNDSVLHKNKINFTKAGIIFADSINTVSETYAKEICEEKEQGCGLNEVLKARKSVQGIVNGIDNSIWNPEKDKLIEKKFSVKTIDNKEENKKTLVEKFGFDYNHDVPVISIISKLTKGKGIDIIKSAFKDLMKLDVQVILLGAGEMEYEMFFEEALMDYRDKFSCYIGFDDKLAHLIEAGSDMLLMPSKHEPCGLNQMYSSIYGTIPIVRETGGLADTVENFDEKEFTGNGFVFQKFTAKDMLKEIKRAVNLYKNGNGAWTKLIKNGMNKDFSWNESTKKYIKLYKEILN
ncbi:MAG: glycogen synthase GlgA [Melioribacteraceae bacterium]|nr:glycogen synthase GlgA [Melioribacteraceae bacterium]